MVFLGLLVMGGADLNSNRLRSKSENLTNLGTRGLISADRRTSLLSCLQYPVPYLSRLQRIYLSNI